MKKKNILLAGISVALVAALSVGATLAYLTAKDDQNVTNTFAFASNITVDLKETTPAAAALGQATASGTNDTGFAYTNVVPGQTLPKNPYVTITSTVDTYLFIKVAGLSQYVSLTTASEITANGWTAVGTVDTYGNGTYYKVMTANDTTAQNIFSQVTISTTATAAQVTANPITIGVSAIQKSGFADASTALASAPAFQGALASIGG